MEYFKIHKKVNNIFIHFFNRSGSIYSSNNKPNLLKELQVDPIEFVDKANAIFNKYKINVPKNFPKNSTVGKEFFDKKIDDFPIGDFLICIHCCSLIEEKYGINTSKILRSELIMPNSSIGIRHACSMAVISYNYIKEGYNVIIPFEKIDQLNPDLIINNLKCEIKTIQESDWTKEIDPDTGLGKKKSRGPDLCYDFGTFIAKENSGYKGILQSDVVFADLSQKSLGDFFSTIRGSGYEDKLRYKLPEPKQCRIIFFSRSYLKCLEYYIDFQPRLWNAIDLASKLEYQRAILFFDIPANGKSHKIKLQIPPQDDE